MSGADNASEFELMVQQFKPFSKRRESRMPFARTGSVDMTINRRGSVPSIDGYAVPPTVMPSMRNVG
jgi:hypothetical protein